MSPACPWCYHTNGSHEPDCIGASKAAAEATRREARDAIESELNALQRKVLAEIARSGGATDEELQERLAMNPSTERPRRVELLEAGLIAAGGRRPTKSGRAAVVWIPKSRAA